MKEEVIGKRYAKALIRLAQEENLWAEIGEDLDRFTDLFIENDLLRRVLCDPVHDRRSRKKILEDILGRMGLNRMTANFLRLLVDKERMRYLPAIRSAYERLEDAMAGRLRAKVVSARALTDLEVAAIRDALARRMGKQIVLEAEEDPEILGGIVCKIDGMVFDGSVRTQLEKLRETIRGE